MFFEVIAREREKEPDEEGDEKGITKIILHLTIVRQSCAKQWPELKKCKKQLEKWKKNRNHESNGMIERKIEFHELAFRILNALQIHNLFYHTILLAFT